MSFLPNDYKAPASSKGSYMKFSQGENKFRILSSAVLGFEAWNTKKECLRRRMDESWDDALGTLQVRDGKPVPPKHFWAFHILNREDNAIQLLTITQSTVMRAIESLVKDPDWGDPKQYDIKVFKSGEGIDTAYSVSPSPHKELEKEIQKQYADYDKNLEDVFTPIKGQTDPASPSDLPF